MSKVILINNNNEKNILGLGNHQLNDTFNDIIINPYTRIVMQADKNTKLVLVNKSNLKPYEYNLAQLNLGTIQNIEIFDETPKSKCMRIDVFILFILIVILSIYLLSKIII